MLQMCLEFWQILSNQTQSFRFWSLRGLSPTVWPNSHNFSSKPILHKSFLKFHQQHPEQIKTNPPKLTHFHTLRHPFSGLPSTRSSSVPAMMNPGLSPMGGGLHHPGLSPRAGGGGHHPALAGGMTPVSGASGGGGGGQIGIHAPHTPGASSTTSNPPANSAAGAAAAAADRESTQVSVSRERERGAHNFGPWSESLELW